MISKKNDDNPKSSNLVLPVKSVGLFEKRALNVIVSLSDKDNQLSFRWPLLLAVTRHTSKELDCFVGFKMIS